MSQSVIRLLDYWIIGSFDVQTIIYFGYIMICDLDERPTDDPWDTVVMYFIALVICVNGLPAITPIDDEF